MTIVEKATGPACFSASRKVKISFCFILFGASSHLALSGEADGQIYEKITIFAQTVPPLNRLVPLLLALLVVLPGAPRARTPHGGGPQYFGPRSNRALVVVEDGKTGDPLIGATVRIASRGDTLQGTTAKRDYYREVVAAYACDRIFRDSVDLEVSYVGYRNFRKRYAPDEFRYTVPVRMEVDPQAIAQVVVVGKRVAMVFRGDTTVYDAGAFKTLADDRFGELVRQLPGVEIRNEKIYANGKEVKRVLIDGRDLFGEATQHVLTDLEASDVKHVRIYEETSPEARRTNDIAAGKEKVMNIETKSKRAVLRGGSLGATLGASLEEDYSGRHEIRHTESASLYRNSERGNLHLDLHNSKDDGQKENAAFTSRITPQQRTHASLEHTLRRGDSTSVMSAVDFTRERSSSLDSSLSDYFPTDEYTLRSDESRSTSRSGSLGVGIRNMTVIRRRQNSFFASANARFSGFDSRSGSRTLRRIDGEQTLTDMHTDNDRRNIDAALNAGYDFRLSPRSSMNLSAGVNYSSGDSDGRQTDTLASTPGLRLRLHNDGEGTRCNINASAAYRYRLGEHGQIHLSYHFTREHNRSRQHARDYLNDPQGVVDTVNSYDYTTDTRRHTVRSGGGYYDDRFRLFGSVEFSASEIVRSERFPEQHRFPRHFLQFNPTLDLSVGSPRRNFSLHIGSYSQTIPVEALRQTLDATNPLSLRTGNDRLRQPNDLSGSASLSLNNAEKALNCSVTLYGSYTFNYITSRTRLFLKETYLPEYDYTAQPGAQLSSQVNVGGCYRVGGSFFYSQQIAPIRSTLRGSLSYNFGQTPYYLDEWLYRSGNHSLSVTAGFNSGFSEKIRLDISTSTVMSSYTTQEISTRDLREQLIGNIDLRLGKYFGQIGVRYEFYCNSRSHELTTHNVLLNLAAGRKFGKENRLSLSVGAVDLINRPDATATLFNTYYILTSTTSYLGRYAYLELGYTF